MRFATELNVLIHYFERGNFFQLNERQPRFFFLLFRKKKKNAPAQGFHSIMG